MLQNGNNRKMSGKSKIPGSLIYNVPGSRSGGIQLRSVRSIVVQSPWGGLCTPFRANKLGAFPAVPDSPLGSRFPRLPAAFWSRIRERPDFYDSFRKFPQTAGFFRFLPAFSACFWKFRSSFKLDIRPFLHFEKCNP